MHIVCPHCETNVNLAANPEFILPLNKAIVIKCAHCGGKTGSVISARIVQAHVRECDGGEVLTLRRIHSEDQGRPRDTPESESGS